MDEKNEEYKNKDMPSSADENAVPERENYEEQLIQIVQEADSLKALKEELTNYHENDIAAALERLTENDQRKLLKAIGADRAAEVFAYLDDMSHYLDMIGNEKAADILEEMDADDAIDLLDEMDSERRAEVEKLLDEDAKKDIDLIASYDEDEIGSRMTTNFILINKTLSIKQAMKELVSQAENNDNISTIYVVNEDGTFYGAIDLNDLIIARAGTDLDTIIVTSYPYVYDHETISDCIEELKDYSEDSIPVLDNTKRVIGVITAFDIVEIVDDEFGEDYAKLAGLVAEEELEEPLIESMKKRLPWLVTLMFLGFLVSSVIGMFETVVQSLALIVCFQSMVLDMSGNVGTQSLAVTIRVLTDGNLTGKQMLRLVFKELRVGFSNGLILGVLSFGVVGLFVMVFMGRSAETAFLVSGCIGIALLLAMMISSMVGTLIPLFFHKIKVDPAVASGPLITTINDLVAVVTYYGLAWMLLINAMHMTGI